jgi:RNA polymerase sigma factor (sigma-70 family)
MKQSEIDVSRSDQRNENDDPEAPTDKGAPTDRLLFEFAATQSEDAFAQIVNRHAGFVYSAALRQTGNPTAAEEITQAVFLILARKAPALRRETVLQGWLFRAVRYAAMDFRKVEARRISREREAARIHSTDVWEQPESVWNQLTPLIDEALASLSTIDRNAVVLRFFENKSFRDIGNVLGGNENSARLRVVRALHKLRGFFQRRGVLISSGLLSAALLVPSSQAAPPALVGSTIGVVASGNCPAAVAAFARAILRRAWWRRWPLWFGGLVAFFLLAVFLAALVRDDPVRTTTQVRATASAIDGAISFGDSDAFINHVHFRNSEQEQFRAVFVAFIQAAAGLRKQVRESYDAQPVRMQIWLWAVGQLFYGQPRRGENSLRTGLVTDDFFQPYLMVMVKIGGTWKWDFFASLPPDVARERMKVLQDKTALCEQVTRGIQKGEITTAEQAFALLQEHSR